MGAMCALAACVRFFCFLFLLLFLLAGFRSNLSSFPARVVIHLAAFNLCVENPWALVDDTPALHLRSGAWLCGGLHTVVRTPSIASVALTSALSRRAPLRAWGLIEERGHFHFLGVRTYHKICFLVSVASY
jgi:hypothetical protein